MVRWMLALAILCFVTIDFIVCPPVTDKPPSTPSPDGGNEEEVVSMHRSTQTTLCSVVLIALPVGSS